MSSDSPNPTDANDPSGKRRATRRTVAGELRITFETAEVTGTIDNLSALGVFFTSQQRVRVRVEVEQDGELRSFAGRLVRVVAMNPPQTGFAIEFDEPLSADPGAQRS